MIFARKQAFTLIEAAVTAGLMAVVGLAIFSAISSGLKIWSYSQRDSPLADQALFFEKLAFEMENSLVYPGLMTRGDASDFSFSSRVGDAPAVIHYVFDKDEGTLSRSVMTLSDMSTGHSGSPALVFQGLASCSFEYYFFNNESQEYIWSKSWPPEEGAARDLRWPVAVTADLEFAHEGKTTSVVKRTISFPLARP